MEKKVNNKKNSVSTSKKNTRALTSNKKSDKNGNNKRNAKDVGLEKKKKFNFKDFISSVLFLKIVFVFLLFLVIFLSFAVYNKNKKEKEEIKANFVVPIKDFNANYSFGIDLKSLVGKKYLFKVTNYRNGEINSQDVYYKVIITNNTSSVISISRDDSKKVIDPGISSESDGIKLNKNKKIADYYYVEVEDAIDVKDEEKIEITVISSDDKNEFKNS